MVQLQFKMEIFLKLFVVMNTFLFVMNFLSSLQTTSKTSKKSEFREFSPLHNFLFEKAKQVTRNWIIWNIFFSLLYALGL